MVKMVRTLMIVSLVAVGASSSLRADDTEIYQSSFSTEDTGRPCKVLIIFDNSGSMRNDVTEQPLPYNPAGTCVSRYNNARIYWSTNGQPPNTNTNQYFAADKNRCAESVTTPWRQLDSSRARRAAGQSPTRGCTPTRNGSTTPAGGALHQRPETRCMSTVRPMLPTQIPAMAVSPMAILPAAGAFNGNGAYRAINLEYSDTTTQPAPLSAVRSNVDWGGQAYTFYTAHYLDYLADPSTTVTRTRYEIAGTW